MKNATQHTGITLILGGARSGKSAYAEKLVLATQLSPVYLATAQARDDEMRLRIAEHQNHRSTGWTTIEEPLALGKILTSRCDPAHIILVDCLTLWLSNLMMADRNIEAETSALIALIPDFAGPVVFVSNEVGMGLVPETALGRTFRDHQGRLNQQIARAADTVSFIAAGYPLILKASERVEQNP